MRAIFFGTPEFAVPVLQAVASVCEVVLVVSQPDKEGGRGRKALPSKTKIAATEMGIPVFQPEKLKDPEVIDLLKEKNADFFFTTAYGKILPRAILDIPKLGCLNLHASLLPKYRGSAPIQWAILNGERETGITLMLMDEGMDTGPILAQEKIEILPNETSGELSKRMSVFAGEFVKRVLLEFLKGNLKQIKQDESLVSYAPPLKKQDGRIDWKKNARQIVCHILGMNPWPCAFTFAQGKMFKILRGVEEKESYLPDNSQKYPGKILCHKGSLYVFCGEGVVKITEIQCEGGKPMDCSSFLCGHKPPESFE